MMVNDDDSPCVCRMWADKKVISSAEMNAVTSIRSKFRSVVREIEKCTVFSSRSIPGEKLVRDGETGKVGRRITTS